MWIVFVRCGRRPKFWIDRTLLEVGVLKYLEGSMECRTRRIICNCFGLSGFVIVP